MVGIPIKSAVECHRITFSLRAISPTISDNHSKKIGWEPRLYVILDGLSLSSTIRILVRPMGIEPAANTERAESFYGGCRGKW